MFFSPFLLLLIPFFPCGDRKLPADKSACPLSTVERDDLWASDGVLIDTKISPFGINIYWASGSKQVLDVSFRGS